MLHFGRYLGGRVVAHEGQAPRAMKMALERNFSKLAFESQTRKIEGDGKEGGVTMADANDPNSPELNVSNIYLTDFRRSEKTFISPLGKSHMNNHPSFENATRQQISNHLTNFCSGTKREKELVGIPVHQAQSNNQTRRVQALLTQQALAALYDLQARAELGGPFRLKAEPKGKPRKPYLLGTVAANMEIKRLRNGDVEVLLTQILRPSAYLQEYGANRTTFKQGIDSKRSIILAQVKIRVPREINAAPVIENFTYESHLASKEGGG